jgi:putative heme transporter
MLASEHTASELTLSPELALPAVDLRALVRRLAVPVLGAAAVVALVLFAGGHVAGLAGALRRTLAVNPAWALVAIAFECLSIGAYIVLLSLVAGRASARIGARESAQVTFAGAAATRLLPTAGAGGAALTLWTLRRAGLGARAAVRTLLVFLVLLYSVFLGAIVVAGLLLATGVVTAHGPVALSAAAASAAAIAIALAMALGLRSSRAHGEDETGVRARLARGSHLLGQAVRDAVRLLRAHDLRLIGAVGYWGFDAAVLWATLHAFGTSPALPVVVLAYFVGQVANTLPLPGSVSGGIAGVLVAFGVPAAVALAAVLAYRTVAVWLPLPPALAALPRFRSTLARWGAEDRAAAATASA